MRRIDKTKVKIPSKLILDPCIARIDDSIVNVGNHIYSNAYYADPSVHKKLFKLYNGKCAFCESDVRAGSALQVDHYRPKNGVKEDTTHSGYYWLGYEWTNLLPICAKCNRSKTTKFPISDNGIRQYSHPPLVNNSVDISANNIKSDDLMNEKPLILNPEVVDPSNYFVFLPSGKINSRGQQEADETINVCKLNRHDLRLARKKLRDDLLRKITEILADYDNQAITKETMSYSIKGRLVDLLDNYTANGPYSVYCLYIIKHFEYFIARRFKSDDKSNLMVIYNNFLKECRNQLI